MCGIVGYVGPQQCAPILMDGLKRLEYRGYDSAGLAVHTPEGLQVVRAAGKLSGLEARLREQPLKGSVGVGHTRWATHGRPSEENAHPHVSGPIAVVHNGIIENHMSLRRRLEAGGVHFESDTDTEIVAHLVHQRVRDGQSVVAAVRAAIAEMEGAYAIAVLSETEADAIVVARKASPLVVGVGEGESFCASDIPALLPYTRDFIFLEEGDVAVLHAGSIQLRDQSGKPVERKAKRVDWSPVMAEKQGYKHFMLKEIHEQPRAIEDTLRGRLDRERGEVVGEEIGLDSALLESIDQVYLVACGTSHHAALLGRYYLEKLARVPTTVELASEFRNRDPVIARNGLVIGVSQSGETADTLAAIHIAKERGAKILSIANVIGSAIPRESDATLYTHAGPEIGVASTKCFTTQLIALLMVAVHIGRRRGTLSAERSAELVEGMAHLPVQMRDVIVSTRQLMASMARRYGHARDVLYLGRGMSFPIALEGALKLKEISYAHAEGYAAGEMKHGPIALLDAQVPVIVVMPKDSQYDKSLANLQEAKARDAPILAVVTEGDHEAAEVADEVVEVPAVAEELAPLLTTIPLQLYAYYVADFKGTDVDQPRNLAKTVTVE